ncbi:MAG: extracellular solute-binding protein [Firmicutes bacterium]|nr:extracellular solute-binding protein [Bacillota bacterium]
MSCRRFTFRTAIVLAFLCVVTFFPAALMPTAAAQEIHLEVWHSWTGFREPLVDKMLQDFMAEHPHIKVTHRIASDLHEEFTLAYAGGVAPDIIMVTTKHLVALADQGVFVELDPWLERDGISRDIWIPGEITSGEWQGKIYGLPIRTGGESSNVLYYNKDVFAEAGLDGSRAPATWDELYNVSRRLVRYDGDDIVLNPIIDITDGATIRPTLNWMFAGGGRYLSDDLRTVAYNTPETANMMEWVYNFRREIYRNVGDDRMARSDFFSGRAAMWFSGSEGFSLVWDYDANFPLGAGPRPRAEGSAYCGANYGTWTYAIPVSTPYKEEAWELLKWLTIREESAGWFLVQQGRPSPVRTFNMNPDYLDVNPYIYVLGEVLECAAPVPFLPIQDDIGIPLRNAFRQVINGEAPAHSALAEAASVSQAVLEQYWAERDAKRN